ncbi:hypothetical protein LOK82_13895 [Xylella fastidiosa subsp. multiplex]|uniref:Uncharacterized protein n=1 Tax=Xylella fastidiosa subsp. multiplex TaxID=644357 RepID=A0AAW6I263_XYLFS|nr:hypothetical protein [Xylella fastidiosa subsp. multiplex]
MEKFELLVGECFADKVIASAKLERRSDVALIFFYTGIVKGACAVQAMAYVQRGRSVVREMFA